VVLQVPTFIEIDLANGQPRLAVHPAGHRSAFPGVYFCSLMGNYSQSGPRSASSSRQVGERADEETTIIGRLALQADAVTAPIGGRKRGTVIHTNVHLAALGRNETQVRSILLAPVLDEAIVGVGILRIVNILSRQP
jgi:hypothetical protein